MRRSCWPSSLRPDHQGNYTMLVDRDFVVKQREMLVAIVKRAIETKVEAIKTRSYFTLLDTSIFSFRFIFGIIFVFGIIFIFGFIFLFICF